MLFRLIHHYLLISITLSFALGIYLSAQYTINPSYLLSLLLLTGGGVLLCSLRQKTHYTHLFILTFFVLLGWINGQISSEKPKDQSHIYNQITAKKEVVLTGFLHNLPGYNSEQSTAVIKLKSIRLEDAAHFSPATGLVKLNLRDRWPEGIGPGDRIAVRAQLYRPRGFKNPGLFDYEKFLLQKDIWITGRIISPLHIAPINHPQTLREKLFYFPQRLRGKISQVIDQSVSNQYGPLYKAILIGDRSGISEETLELFRNGGCMHILAISGLHMGIIAAFLFFTFYWLIRRSEWLILHIPTRKTAALLCLIPLLLYTMIAGGNTPVVRSFLMSTVVILSLCLNRRKHPFSLLSLAALLILAFNPQSLFSASFQLSFAAVASIIGILPLIHEYLIGDTTSKRTPVQKGKIWILSALLLSITATIGVLPLLLYHFNRFSFVGPIVNLIVEPLICLWSLVLGFLAIGFLFISPAISEILFQLGSYGFIPAVKVLQIFSRVPFASIYLPTPSTFLLLIYFTALLSVFIFKQKRAVLLGYGVLFLILIFFFIPPLSTFKRAQTDSTLTFMDVGHGSSTLIQFPGKTNILIDGGALTSKHFNIGERVIGPYLWRSGIRHLDGIVITHTDSDHFNGLFFIIEHFKPATLWTNRITAEANGYAQLLQLAKKQGVNIRIPNKQPTPEGPVLINP